MNSLFMSLHSHFCQNHVSKELLDEADRCYKELLDVLDKTDRKLALRLIDSKNLSAEYRSLDSFINGFNLAWQLAYELKQNEERNDNKVVTI